jgi:hypothetical protein
MPPPPADPLTPVHLKPIGGEVCEVKRYDLTRPWRELAQQVRADAGLNPAAGAGVAGGAAEAAAPPFWVILRATRQDGVAAVAVLGGVQPDGRELAPDPQDGAPARLELRWDGPQGDGGDGGGVPIAVAAPAAGAFGAPAAGGFGAPVAVAAPVWAPIAAPAAAPAAPAPAAPAAAAAAGGDRPPCPAGQSAEQHALYDGMQPAHQAVVVEVLGIMGDFTVSQVAAGLRYYDNSDRVMNWLFSGAPEVEAARRVGGGAQQPGIAAPAAPPLPPAQQPPAPVAPPLPQDAAFGGPFFPPAAVPPLPAGQQPPLPPGPPPAAPPPGIPEEHVRQLMEMGFAEDQVRVVLGRTGGDLGRAMEALM